MRTIQGNWHQEYGKLKAKIEVLSKSQRHLMGEQLDSLSHKELQQLENQLDNSLKHIRSRKVNHTTFSRAKTKVNNNTTCMCITISFLFTGEGTTGAKQEFGEASEFVTLFAQILEEQKAKALTQQPHWEQAQTSSSSPPFLLADADHTLNIGCYQGRATIGGEVEAAEVQARINGSILPPWMLNHLNG
ncbi:hypothetical protein ZIOFF_028212 [Zingiber officinale]|uniref:K-box domain-containing protein n=1 Tax=Zingiber officinale TaxID=94328 RepID=A0A8J5GRQ0_ZINOF|nr:hypothetical protein ZIOFF_028212 [Zingiber officinale]